MQALTYPSLARARAAPSLPVVPGRRRAGRHLSCLLQDSASSYQDVEMTGDSPSAGNPPGPGGTPELRASHEDRERTVDILRTAAGDGRLTADELDERLEAALSARTVGELGALTADLPAPPGGSVPPAKDLVRIVQNGGSATRRGRWRVPRRMDLLLAEARATLDFTEALISHPTLRIDTDIRGGLLTLVVKPGIVVDADDLTVREGAVKVRPGTDQPAPVTLHVRLVGQVSAGQVVVRLPRRTFAQWVHREARPYRSPAD
jgi:hypothetical protein